jgi:hypothetical protein
LTFSVITAHIILYIRVRSVANCLRYRICSISAYFSVARFISGGYYRSSFESVIESIVR